MSIKLCDQELEHIRCHVCSSCDVCVEATGGHRKGSPQCGGVGEEARSTAAPPGWYLESGGGPAPDRICGHWSLFIINSPQVHMSTRAPFSIKIVELSHGRGVDTSRGGVHMALGPHRCFNFSLLGDPGGCETVELSHILLRWGPHAAQIYDTLTFLGI